jgi:hypothetical protein
MRRTSTGSGRRHPTRINRPRTDTSQANVARLSSIIIKGVTMSSDPSSTGWGTMTARTRVRATSPALNICNITRKVHLVSGARIRTRYSPMTLPPIFQLLIVGKICADAVRLVADVCVPGLVWIEGPTAPARGGAGLLVCAGCRACVLG